MSFIAMSLDILQGEEKAYVGRLLPTLAGVLVKLKSKRNDDLNQWRTQKFVKGGVLEPKTRLL